MPLAHDTEHREVGKNHVAGALNRYGARSWESFERYANRKRGCGANYKDAASSGRRQEL